MITLEEAIDIIENKIQIDVRLCTKEEVEQHIEALTMACSALRPVSREQAEKVWRGKWIGMTDDDGCTWYECSRCEHDLDSLEELNHFCPACGVAMYKLAERHPDVSAALLRDMVSGKRVRP